MGNNNIDWNQVRINYVGLALQGMLEREESIFGKVISDVFYERMAGHCVKLADACIRELRK